MITLIGLLAGLLVFVLFQPPGIRRGDASKRLAAMYSVEKIRTLSGLKPGSLEYKLLAAGINLEPTSFWLLAIAAGLAGMALCWTFLPGLPAIVLGGIVVWLPYAWLGDRVKNRGREIDRLLPVAIGRITAGLLAGGSVTDVLQKTGESLELEGPNPLSPELLLTSAELRSKPRAQAMHALAARSPSSSLANLAYLLESYTESGGIKYSEVLMSISQRVQLILVSRNRAIAKAGDAMVSARIIPVMLVVVFLFLTRDPLIRSSLTSLPVQLLLGGAISMMVLGYFLIRSMVSEAV